MLADPLSSYTSGTTIAVTGGKPFIWWPASSIPWRPTAGISSSAANFGGWPIRVCRRRYGPRWCANWWLRAAPSGRPSSKDLTAEAAAHHAVDVAKRKLGERGPVWWTDGSPDLNKHMVKNTPYASWYSDLRTAGRREQRIRSLDMDGGQMP
jgi:hypothetical protein